jgi:ribosomal protein S1
MIEQHPAAIARGDSITVTITKTLPFGAFVETADGTVGLATDLRNGAVGDLVTIRVDGVDDVKHRFSGTATN